MESQIDLEYEDIKGWTSAKMVRFIGDLDATNVETVLEKICTLFKDGFINIVADFSKSAKEKGGSFKIANVNENVYEIIEIIGATSLLEIYDDVNEAVAALK